MNADINCPFISLIFYGWDLRWKIHQFTVSFNTFQSKSFNSISKSNLPSFLFAWEDIKPVREKITKKEVNAIAIINDINKDIKLEFLEALESKHAKYILWSEKDEEKNIELLNSA